MDKYYTKLKHLQFDRYALCQQVYQDSRATNHQQIAMELLFSFVCVVFMHHHATLAVGNAYAWPCQSPIGPNNVCYWLAPQSTTSQLEAVEICDEDGGILASVTSAEVAQFLEQHIDFNDIR